MCVEHTLLPVLDRMRSNIQLVDSGKEMIEGEWRVHADDTSSHVSGENKQPHLNTLTTTDGDTYNNVSYKSSDGQKVSFSHDAGIARISWEKLTKEDQIALGFDAEKMKADQLLRAKSLEEKQRLAVPKASARPIANVQTQTNEHAPEKVNQDQTLDSRIAEEKEKQVADHKSYQQFQDDSAKRDALINSKINPEILKAVRDAEEEERVADENLKTASRRVSKEHGSDESVKALVLAQKALQPAAEKRVAAYNKLSDEKNSILLAIIQQESEAKRAKENAIIDQQCQRESAARLAIQQKEDAERSEKESEAQKHEDVINESSMKHLAEIPENDSTSDELPPKVKGICIGMNIKKARNGLLESLKEYGCGVGEIIPVTFPTSKNGYKFMILAPNSNDPNNGIAYGDIVCADENGKIVYIRITPMMANILFKSQGLSAQEFINQFAVSYGIDLLPSEDRQAVYNTSPNGVKVLISIERDIVLKRVPSVSEKASSFN